MEPQTHLAKLCPTGHIMAGNCQHHKYMRTLILSSAGVRFPTLRKELLKILSKPPSKVKLAHITTASKVETDTAYVDGDRSVFREIGFQAEDIDIGGKTERELKKVLAGKDVIYVQGGNTFYLLREIRSSGFANVIKPLLDKGTVYVGVSAGTYVACATIEMQEWKRAQDDHYGLTDLTGMGFVPFLISVHFNREKYREKVKEGIKKASLPVRILTDDQALLIKGNSVTLVGTGKEIKLP